MMKNSSSPIELIEPVWERQPGESGDWYRRFCRYRNQVGKRSLISAVRAEAAEKGGNQSQKKPPGSWQVARQKWRWDERVLAWDQHQQDIQDFEWDERYKLFRQSCWEDYELLHTKAVLMLQMPIATQTTTKSENGITLITIEATDWNKFLPALAMLKLSMEMAQTAIGRLSIAATLLNSAGFTVQNPKTAEQADSLFGD